MKIFFKTALILLFTQNLFSFTKEEQRKSDASENTRVNAFLDRAFYRMIDRNPQYAAYLGIKVHNDAWTSISDSFYKADLKASQQELDSLKNNFDYNKLDANTKISWRLFEKNVKDQEEGWKFHLLSFPVNQEDGLHTEVPTFLVNVHLIHNVQEAKDYITRLQKVNPLFAQLISNLKERELIKVIPPKFVYPKVIAACKAVITGAPFDATGKLSPLMEDFNRKVEGIPNISLAQKDSLKSEATKALKNAVAPAYTSLSTYLTQLETKADTVVGAWSWPKGDAFYKMSVKRYTTTDMSPDEIYNYGLSEVARIQKEIHAIMKRVKFKNDDIHDFFDFVKDPNNRKSFLPQTEAGQAAYLSTATGYINTMRDRLGEIFITKPKASIIVKAVEKFRESSAGSAFYEQPAIDGSRPGRFYVNLSDMSQSPMYQLEALAYHEGIPGHHMQISIAQELTGVPQFRKFADYTAYVEGWALYCEYIPKEMGGFYTDPYSDFGRLTMELLRAARCVVDPGIHAKHWSRTKALNYFLKNTAEPPIECEHAIERYIVWPGQATAYKIGMRKIIDLREMARKELGDKFSIREFHDVVLTSGAVTLDILEENVKAWIKRLKN